MTTGTQPAILVVDDESEILYSLRGLLRKEYDFHAAQSGYEGLKVLEGESRRNDLDRDPPGRLGTPQSKVG